MQTKMEFTSPEHPKVIEVFECAHRDVDLHFVANNALTAEYAIKATQKIISTYNTAYGLGVVIERCRHEEAVVMAWEAFKSHHPDEFSKRLTYILEYGYSLYLHIGVFDRVIKHLLSLEAGASKRQLIAITETFMASAAQVEAARKMFDARGVDIESDDDNE